VAGLRFLISQQVRADVQKRNHLLRLPPGEDLWVSLHRVCRERNTACSVSTAIGAARSATLSHPEQNSGKVSRQVLDTGLDLGQCSGNIGPLGDNMRIRACAALCDASGQISTGELLAAEAYAEVSVRESEGKPQVRQQDPETGLWLWPVAW
jgi:predicted DNA-binding protein with PD1-like motif